MQAIAKGLAIAIARTKLGIVLNDHELRVIEEEVSNKLLQAQEAGPAIISAPSAALKDDSMVIDQKSDSDFPQLVDQKSDSDSTIFEDQNSDSVLTKSAQVDAMDRFAQLKEPQKMPQKAKGVENEVLLLLEEKEETALSVGFSELVSAAPSSPASSADVSKPTVVRQKPRKPEITPASDTRACSKCGRSFKAKGFKTHFNSCKGAPPPSSASASSTQTHISNLFSKKPTSSSQ